MSSKSGRVGGGRRYVVLELLARLAVSRPRSVLLVALAVTAGASAVVPRIQIVTDRGALVSSDDPAQARYDAASASFGSQELAIAVLQGDDRQVLRTAADELAERLEASELVGSVFHKLDLGFFLRHALLYLSDDEFQCVSFALGGGGLGGATTGRMEPGLLGLIAGIQSGIENASVESQVPEACQGVSPLDIMTRLFAEVGAWVEDERRSTLDVVDAEGLTGSSLTQYGVDDEGYLIESDARAPLLVFLLVQPITASNDEDAARALTREVREAAGEVARRHGVQAGVTGMPAITTDEMDTVRRDLRKTITSAIVFVLLLFLATYRSLRATALVALPLVLGLVWTAGFAALAYERLTMVSVYFAAVLFGLGIAFGIHLISRFDEALRAGSTSDEAVRAAMTRAGPGIITGGVTTAAAFLAVGLVEFQGFAQLGNVAGVGVLLMLVGSLTVMPAAMGLWRGAPVKEPRSREWLGSFGRAVARAAFPIAALATIGTGLGFWAARTIPFDYDFTKLLPRDVEALTYYQVLQDRSDFNSDIAISVAPSLAEAESRRQRLEALETVSRAESVSRYLPGPVEDQRARVDQLVKLAATSLESLREVRAGAREALGPDRRQDPAAVVTALKSLGDAVEDAWFAAQQTKRAETADLAKLRDVVRASAAKVEAVPAARAVARLGALERELFSGLEKGLDVVIANLESPAVMNPEDLPASVRQRLVAREPDGSALYAVYAYPTGRVGDRDFLVRFVDEARQIDPDITGFPLTHYAHGEMASRAFFQAALYAAIAVLLLLVLDFRKPREVVLAAIPLAVGASAMLGTMALAGWTFNFVNVVAFPLVIGAGVDFGVHLVHRFRQEGSAVAALRTTGRPVVLSAVTTLVGIGGLAAAEHRGAASLGVLLILGIGFCLLSAAVVLPAAMTIWSRRGAGAGAAPTSESA